MNFLILLFAALGALVELSPLILAVAIWRAANEYIRRGKQSQPDPNSFSSRFKKAWKAF